MRMYLAAHVNKFHEQHFGWKTFRVLVVTIDAQRLQLMQETLNKLQTPNSIGASLFLFATASELTASDPLALAWRDGNNLETRLIAHSH
jgi:hypothetical protein